MNFEIILAWIFEPTQPVRYYYYACYFFVRSKHALCNTELKQTFKLGLVSCAKHFLGKNDLLSAF
jgi:hypothetical protein